MYTYEVCIYVCMYFFMYVCESVICCRCIFLKIMFMFMISISIGPDAGVNFLNARASSNGRSQVADKRK
jgi:hypothetical protein